MDLMRHVCRVLHTPSTAHLKPELRRQLLVGVFSMMIENCVKSRDNVEMFSEADIDAMLHRAKFSGLLKDDEYEEINKIGHDTFIMHYMSQKTYKLLNELFHGEPYDDWRKLNHVEPTNQPMTNWVIFLGQGDGRFFNNAGDFSLLNGLAFPLKYIQQSRVLWILSIIILPFDLAPEMGWFTVIATFIYTLSYFSLDRITTDLESPLGVDENDLPAIAVSIRCERHSYNMLQISEVEGQPAELDAIPRYDFKDIFRFQQAGTREQKRAKKAMSAAKKRYRRLSISSSKTDVTGRGGNEIDEGVAFESLAQNDALEEGTAPPPEHNGEKLFKVAKTKTPTPTKQRTPTPETSKKRPPPVKKLVGKPSVTRAAISKGGETPEPGPAISKGLGAKAAPLTAEAGAEAGGDLPAFVAPAAATPSAEAPAKENKASAGEDGGSPQAVATPPAEATQTMISPAEDALPVEASPMSVRADETEAGAIPTTEVPVEASREPAAVKAEPPAVTEEVAGLGGGSGAS